MHPRKQYRYHKDLRDLLHYIFIERPKISTTNTPNTGLDDAQSLCRLVEETLDTHKGADIVSISLEGKSSFADYIVLASGTSRRHVHALCEYVRTTVKKSDHDTLAIEGGADSDWMLLDLGDVVVHIFTSEMRAFYNLEEMWTVAFPDKVPSENE